MLGTRKLNRVRKKLIQRFRHARPQCPLAVKQLHTKSQLREWPLGAQIADRFNQENSGGSLFGQWFSRISVILSSTLTIFLNLFFVIFVALFFAFEPDTYRSGVLSLVPPKRRDTVITLKTEVRQKLYWWLLGRLLSMALLVALSEGMLWPVLVLYLLVQAVESNVITPLVDRRSVKLPPALLLSAQIIMGLIAGLFGLILAAPLTVLTMVVIKRLHVDARIEQRPIDKHTIE